MQLRSLNPVFGTYNTVNLISVATSMLIWNSNIVIIIIIIVNIVIVVLIIVDIAIVVTDIIITVDVIIIVIVAIIIIIIVVVVAVVVVVVVVVVVAVAIVVIVIVIVIIRYGIHFGISSQPPLLSCLSSRTIVVAIVRELDQRSPAFVSKVTLWCCATKSNKRGATTDEVQSHFLYLQPMTDSFLTKTARTRIC
jgi:hypothetical protein